MNYSLRLLAALIALLFLAGCGQSGPLYIPGNPSTVEVNGAEQQSDEEEDDADNGATRP